MSKCKSIMTNCLIDAEERMNGNGVYLFAPPTGSGKSHVSGEYAALKWLEGKRLWIMTVNKHNVETAIENLRRQASEVLTSEECEELESCIIHLKANEDCWSDNIDGIECSDVAYLGKKAEGWLKKIKENEKERMSYVESIGLSGTGDEDVEKSKQFILDNFTNKFIDNESSLRKALKKDIQTELGMGKNKQEKLQRYLNRHPWIRKVYPYVDIDRKTENGRLPIVFCTISKAALPCDTLTGTSDYLFSQMSKLGGTVIIDEVDQSKDAFKTSILGQSAAHNIFKIASIVFNGFTESNLADLLKIVDKEAEESSEKKMRAISIHGFLRDLKREGQRLMKEYSLGVQRREFDGYTRKEIIENFYWILRSAYFTLVGKPLFQGTTDTGAVLLSIVPEENTVPLRRIYGEFMNYIKRWLGGSGWFLTALADKNHRANPYENANISSYLCLIGFEPKTPEHNYIMEVLKKGSTKRKSELNSTYDEGIFLAMPSLVDEDTERNTITTFSFETTPEAILTTIASECFVIGMSATADIKSVLSNYNWEWIKEHDIPVEIPNAQEMKYIESRQKERFQYLDAVQIKADILPEIVDAFLKENASNSTRLLETIEKETLRILESKTDGNHDYYFERVKRIANALLYFAFTPEHKAGLIETTKAYGVTAKNLMDVISEMTGINVKVLPTIAKTLKRNTAIAQSCLRNGERVVIVAPFASSKQAWNFDYKLADNDTDYIKVSDIGKMSIDFDYLYVGVVTNILPPASQGGDENWGVKKLTEIYAVMELYESGEISSQTRNRWIKSYMSGLGIKKEEQIMLLSYQWKLLSDLIQVIGRLERAQLKRPVTVVHYDKEFAYNIKSEIVNEFMSKHVINPVTKTVLESIAEKSEGIASVVSTEENKLTRQASYVGCELDNQFGKKSDENPYRDSQMSLRRRECAFTLRYPRAVPEMGHFDIDPPLKQFYLGTERKFYYKASGNWRNVEISFEPLPGYRLFDESEALLPELMQNAEVHRGFEEKGFATSWGEAGFQMAPPLMNNIYKGEIGEQAFRILLENRGIVISDIEEPNIFEACDFKCNGIPFDAKNYRPQTYQSGEIYTDREKTLSGINNKMRRLNSGIYVTANVFADGNKHTPYEVEKLDSGITYVVNGVIDINTGKIVEENMQILLEILLGRHTV